MKKLAAILCASALSVGAFAQGTISFLNTSTTLISTNGVASGLGSGVTGVAAQGFYYGLFTASSTVTSMDPNAQELLTSAWTFTGNYATNLASAGRLNGGANVATVTGWTPGQTNSFVIAGWSANLGHDWSTIAAELTGAQLAGGLWSGANWAGQGYFGLSVVSFGMAGGGTTGLSQFQLFGNPSGQGNSLTAGWSLYATAVPEPATVALAGIGAAALLIFRRRK